MHRLGKYRYFVDHSSSVVWNGHKNWRTNKHRGLEGKVCGVVYQGSILSILVPLFIFV